MRTINGEEFLSPQEAAQKLAISYKTLQRWSDNGGRWIWVRATTNGNGNSGSNGNGSGPAHGRTKEWRTVNLDVIVTRAGHRLYRRDTIEQLLSELVEEEKDQRHPVAA
jgi:hypothetical protein